MELLEWWAGEVQIEWGVGIYMVLLLTCRPNDYDYRTAKYSNKRINFQICQVVKKLYIYEIATMA